MKLEDLEVGKKYLLVERHVAELVAKDASNVYFNIEGEHDYIPEAEYDKYPGTVGILFHEDLITEL